MDIIRYSDSKKGKWNAFLDNSKNGLFLFDRDYMEYHSDRFADFSLMIYEQAELIAILPANVSENTLFSHAGLTFGGFITDKEMKTATMLKIFNEVIKFISGNAINRIIYKCIPYIYHSIPAEEDRYTLFRVGAKLFRRDVTSTIYLPETTRFQELRRRGIKKAVSSNIKVKKTDDFKAFWHILENNLSQKHNTKPVHSIDEIEYLHSKFPENIKLFASYEDETMVSGVVVYESKNVAHAQYIANSEEVKDSGSLDITFSYLITDYYKAKRYFDFGISTEKDGFHLNEGLIFFKEGFGARSIVHDFYEINI